MVVSADYLFFLVRSVFIAVVHGKVIKMMINAFGDNRNFRVHYIFLLRYRCFLPVRYLARNSVFNRLPVYFAKSVKYTP